MQCQQYQNSLNSCFQILGYDIIIDNNMKPWLIEINQFPSFATDSPLDYQIKFGLVKDSLKIMRLTPTTR